MNITAKELSGMHIGKKIKLGATYATIKKIESNAQTVDLRAEYLNLSSGPEAYFLSIPVDAIITIQANESTGPIGVGGTAVMTNRFGTPSHLVDLLPKNRLIESQSVDFLKATCIELIRNGKRDTIRYGEPGVKIYLQDDGRTLKIHFKEE
ncbi:hypothetical protein ACIOJF_03710 [Glutamicibacter sp. NPDC087831]|uniref:hypothetical protein n=1 Tax=Glutamicibacter sp. NPDC087831 TaxID=3363998 RepID=UPI00380CB427